MKDRKKLAIALALLGVPQPQIAQAFGVTPRTLTNWNAKDLEDTLGLAGGSQTERENPKATFLRSARNVHLRNHAETESLRRALLDLVKTKPEERAVVVVCLDLPLHSMVEADKAQAGTYWTASPSIPASEIQVTPPAPVQPESPPESPVSPASALETKASIWAWAPARNQPRPIRQEYHRRFRECVAPAFAAIGLPRAAMKAMERLGPAFEMPASHQTPPQTPMDSVVTANAAANTLRNRVQELAELASQLPGLVLYAERFENIRKGGEYAPPKPLDQDERETHLVICGPQELMARLPSYAFRKGSHAETA